MLELQKHIIYGPVNSRRLGSSLGVNVLPVDQKVCTLNCLYCQYGWTNVKKMKDDSGLYFPSVSEILTEVEMVLKQFSKPLNYITFSGNGEATLHPEFSTIVDGVIGLRNQYLSETKTAILSNSTTVHQPLVRKALSKLDVRIMKLDAGNESMFRNYSQPVRDVSLEMIVDGLSSLEDVTIQTLFTSGLSGNATCNNIRTWMKQLMKIAPRLVQIYTLDRGYPSDNIDKLNPNELKQVQAVLRKVNIQAEVY